MTGPRTPDETFRHRGKGDRESNQDPEGRGGTKRGKEGRAIHRIGSEAEVGKSNRKENKRWGTARKGEDLR